MSGFIYSGGFLPYCIKTLNEDGKPFQKWDGSTYDDTTGLPADSDGNTVYGDKSIYCIKLSLSQLMDLFWSARSIKISSDINGNGSMSAAVTGVSSQKSLSISNSEESKMYPDPWIWGRSVSDGVDNKLNKPSDLTNQLCYPSLTFRAQKGVDGSFDESFPSSGEGGVTISPGRYSKSVSDSKDDVHRVYCGTYGGYFSCGSCPDGVQEVGRCGVDGTVSVTHALGDLDVIRVTNSSGKYEYWIRPFFKLTAGLSLNSSSDHSRGFLYQSGNCFTIDRYEELCDCDVDIYAGEGALGGNQYYRIQAIAKRDVNIEAPYDGDVSKLKVDPYSLYSNEEFGKYTFKSQPVTVEIKFKNGSTASATVSSMVGSGRWGFDNQGRGGTCTTEGDLSLGKITVSIEDTLDYSTT